MRLAVDRVRQPDCRSFGAPMTKILFAILPALPALTQVRAAERYPFSLDTLLDDAADRRGALRAPAQQCAAGSRS